MTPINPPTTDETIPRHQFYASLAATVATNSSDIDGIGKKIVKLTEANDKVKEVLATNATRNKTLISAVVVMWTLLGGSITVYVNRSIANIDTMGTRITELEKKAEASNPNTAKIGELVARMDAMKNIVSEQQRQIDVVRAEASENKPPSRGK